MSELNTHPRLDAVARHQTALKTALHALREAKKKKKEHDREIAVQINGLIGAAMVGDLETAPAELRGRRKAYISEVLNRHYDKNNSTRALLVSNGWL